MDYGIWFCSLLFSWRKFWSHGNRKSLFVSLFERRTASSPGKKFEKKKIMLLHYVCFTMYSSEKKETCFLIPAPIVLYFHSIEVLKHLNTHKFSCDIFVVPRKLIWWINTVLPSPGLDCRRRKSWGPAFWNCAHKFHLTVTPHSESFLWMKGLNFYTSSHKPEIHNFQCLTTLLKGLIHPPWLKIAFKKKLQWKREKCKCSCLCRGTVERISLKQACQARPCNTHWLLGISA